MILLLIYHFSKSLDTAKKLCPYYQAQLYIFKGMHILTNAKSGFTNLYTSYKEIACFCLVLPLHMTGLLLFLRSVWFCICLHNIVFPKAFGRHTNMLGKL